MKNLSIKTISQKITLLNKTILDSMTEKGDNEIVKNFTETGNQILGTDFGFAWWKFNKSDKFKLVYKSPGTPYNPFLPKKTSNHYNAIKKRKLILDSNVKSRNYISRGLSDISPYMKSFIIIPIYHDKHIYGSITLCYKKRHNFTKEELTLAQAIGHTTAQAITIHRLMTKERETLIFTGKQKETEVLLEQEKLKTEFMANATHELRTPLAIMKGNVDLGLMSRDSLKSTQDALKAVNVEIKILSEVLQDLGLLTTFGKNAKRAMKPVSVNIKELLQKVIKRSKILASKKNINIQIKTEKINGLRVLGDKKYLEKLFLIIIRNAITYDKKNGNIIIDLERNKNLVKIKITDNGVGISKEDLPRIFERFYRSDKTRNTYGQHSGLGLAIAKWITELHEGKITAQSIYGKGSTFTITLPIIKNS